MKHLITFLIVVLVAFTAFGQTAPPNKLRSNDSFTQVDNYLVAAKRLGIPAGDTPTLNASTSPQNSAKLFYNTTDETLYVYDAVSETWNPVSADIDLSNYYTIAQVDSAITSQIGLINFPVTSVNGKTGAVTVTKADVGLGNVDNTSDVNKPISTATQGALDGKENAFSKGSLVAGTGVTLDGTLSNRLVGSGNVTINSTSSLTASNGLQINSGVISPVYGTASGTVAQGNDSRIVNGQTAFGWGDYKVAWSMTAANQYNTRPNSRFTSTSAGNSDFNGYGAGLVVRMSDFRQAQIFAGLFSGELQWRYSNSGTSMDYGDVRTIWDSGNLPSPASFGTAGGEVRTNTQLDARYVQSIGAGAGISVSGTTVSVDGTVVRTTGNQSISGTKTFSSPVKGQPAQNADEFTTLSQIPVNLVFDNEGEGWDFSVTQSAGASEVQDLELFRITTGLSPGLYRITAIFSGTGTGGLTPLSGETMAYIGLDITNTNLTSLYRCRATFSRGEYPGSLYITPRGYTVMSLYLNVEASRAGLRGVSQYDYTPPGGSTTLVPTLKTENQQSASSFSIINDTFVFRGRAYLDNGETSGSLTCNFTIDQIIITKM